MKKLIRKIKIWLGFYKPGYAYVMAKQNGIFIPKKGK